MWTRAELKENAKKYFKFNYWKMVLVAFIMGLIGGGNGGVSFGTRRQYTTTANGSSGIMSSAQMAEIAAYIAAFLVIFAVIMVIAIVLDVFVFAPLRVGGYRFFVVSHYQKAELGELGFAFTHSYLNIVKTMFLRGLFTTLWTILLVVPGIIKAYEYRMIPYILAENPDIDTKEAFARSKQIMTGNKMDAFVLDWSFFGWWIFRAITCGIVGIFWVNPYIHMTNAELYVALKEITYGGNGQNYSNANDNIYTQNMNQQWNGQQNMN